MDLLMGVLKSLIIVYQIDPLVLTKIVAITPLKITQADAAPLLFLKIHHTGEDWIIS